MSNPNSIRNFKKLKVGKRYFDHTDQEWLIIEEIKAGDEDELMYVGENQTELDFDIPNLVHTRHFYSNGDYFKDFFTAKDLVCEINN